MRSKLLISASFLLSIIALVFFSCTLTPTSNQFGPENTTITLTGKSSQNILYHGIVDSIGNTVSVGVSSNLPSNLESVDLRLVITGGNDSLLHQFTNLKSLSNTDISWYSLSFSDTGTKTIYGVANVPGATKIISDTILVTIHGKPPNHKPSIVITGLTTIAMNNQCSFIVTASDTDKLQLDSIKYLSLPANAVFNAGTFIWTPPTGFVGIDSAVFMVWDNGYPIMRNTSTVIITVTGTSGNHAPKWQSKTINESGRPGIPISISLSDKCSDIDGDTLTFSLLSGAPDGDAIVNKTYSFTPGPGDTGVFQPQIVASDSKGGFDTLTITLTVQAPSVLDTVAPVMTLLSILDNESVSSSTLPMTIRCIDPSGVASVRCFIGTDTFHVTVSDSGKYSATVSGLKKDIFNVISFVAVDASSRANTDTLLVHIKYDSTITDNVPPIVTLISPFKDTIVGSDSCVVQVKATDASGIASVIYAIGSQTFPATKSSGDLYIASVKGLTPGAYSTVTITVTDASPAQNKATTSVKIKCDNDKTPPTLKLVLPAKDSTSVAGNATTVQVVCKDASGVASLTYGVAGSSQPMTKSANADSIWSANITGLLKGQFTTITLEATDGSLAANKATLLLHIKYDTTMADATGPVITKVSGLADNTRTANPNDTLVYTVTDASGVDTVSWSLNGTPSGVLTQEANGHYSIKALLSAPHKNTIVLFASDKSPSHNKSSDTTIIDYNRPPVISGAYDTTIQELSTIQFTMSAIDPESDKVTLSTASTLPTGATFDATTGIFKWTVAAGQKGTSITFKANDGLDTATKTISIVVSNMPPPVISKNPVSDTVCLGSPATFSITASGTGLTYQWKNALGNLTEGHYAGTKTNTLTIATAASGDDGTYTCVVTNSAASIASSNGAKLTINTSTSITTQPAPVTVCVGAKASFTVAASGAGTLKYQWQKDGANISGATSATYAIASPASTDAGKYTCNVTGDCGTATSNAADLAINTGTSITTQPTAVTSCAGTKASFTVAASGAGTLKYQWQKDGANISGATSATYAIASPASTDAGKYTCNVTGDCGTATSNAAALAINTGTSITTQPTAVTSCAGTKASFTVAASGAGTLKYQWQKDGANISGATSATYAIASPASTDAGKYTCVVTGDCGTATSNAAALAINTGTSITTQPTAVTSCAGTKASFTVASSGAGTLKYQWQKDGANISGATSATYSITSPASGDVGKYTCVVTGDCGTATSNAAALTINAAPSISTQPASVTTCAGNPASFTVAASGTGSIKYQWQKDGTNISSANSATYTISSASTPNAGKYTCIITGDCGSVTSNGATLSITAPPTITTQPIDQSIPIGNSVTFSVQATGTNLSYQWRKNGVNIANANSATYTIAKVSSADAVAYSCSVTAGGCGSVTSKSAYLSVQNHFFGESFGGGLIFYIDGTGQHGLIAASSDQSNPDNNQVWGCGGTSSPTTSNNFGAGSSNTNSIVSGCGGGTNSAAGVCKSYTGGGYTDWYLPSFAELDTLYKNKTSAFNMDQGIYWSSSGDSGGEAVMISFSDGMARQMPLTIAYQVRAIRSF